MSQVISIRLEEDQVERLERFARRFGKSQSEMGATFLEESMREAEFAKIEFRDSSLGRQACMQSSNLAVWEVSMIARDLEMDAQNTADYFHRPPEWVEAAFRYYEAYPEEIDPAIEANRQTDYEALKQRLPGLRLIEVAEEEV